MSRSKQHRRKQGKNTAQPKKTTLSTPPDQDWSRAGAHNIAGVSFQVAVTARLLLDGRAGELPLTRVTPEGYEDIDIEFNNATRALVQVKDRSTTRVFRRSDFAHALANKSDFLARSTSSRFVLATDATLGEGLAVTGWEQTLSQCLSTGEVEKLAAQLEASFDEPYEVLARTHVLKVERDVVEESRCDCARILEIQPSVAALAYARLIEQITEIAVRQRYTTPQDCRVDCPF